MMEDQSKSEEAKSNFLARMSHEMRTPLNAIIGMSTIAQSTEDLEKIHSCLEKINEASVYLMSMINDVLDIAKIEAGSFVLVNDELDLTSMLVKSAEKTRFTLEAKKQNLVLDFDPDLPASIIADEQRFAQVLDHFLSNAVKFTPPEGTITLSVKCIPEKNRDSSDCTLEIKVIDTGIGIPEDRIKNIFDLFEQGDGGMNRKYSGAGLGLYICSSIARLMGATISVDSVPGKGSTFSFTVTVQKGKSSLCETKPGAAGSAQTETESKYAGVKILLAEDVEINREIVTSLLEDTGMIIECAENGLRAVEMYRANPEYSLILMDIHMPEMDGFEATRQIRALDPSHKIPIVAMTANVFKDDVDKCMAAGMTSHLGKPIDFEELMKELDKQLSAAR